MEHEASRILVIQTAFIGDIVLCTSFLRSLRTLFPKASIYCLTTSAGKSILENNPWDVKILIFDKRKSESGLRGLWRKIKELRELDLDIVYCLHRSIRSTLLAYFSQARRIEGFQEGAASWLFHAKVSRTSKLYEAEKNQLFLDAITGKNISSQSLYPELAHGIEDKAMGDTLLKPLEGKPFLAICPCSVWRTKRWLPERFAEIIHWAWTQHELPCVLIGSSMDYEVVQTVLDAYPGPPPSPCLNVCGKTSLGTLKYILGKAKAVLSNDSAPLHIANAMGAPVVGVFGPTTKELGFFPMAPKGRAFVAELSLACRPCGKHGHQSCPLGHFRCMGELSTARVQSLLGVVLRDS